MQNWFLKNINYSEFQLHGLFEFYSEGGITT